MYRGWRTNMEIIRGFGEELIDPRIFALETLVGKCVKAQILTKAGAEELLKEVYQYAF